MNGLGMNGKNDDLWEAIIYLGLNRLTGQMLKTDLEGNNGENTSKDDPPFPTIISLFSIVSPFSRHFPDALWKTSLLKEHYSNYKPLDKIATIDEISFLLGFNG